LSPPFRDRFRLVRIDHTSPKHCRKKSEWIIAEPPMKTPLSALSLRHAQGSSPNGSAAPEHLLAIAEFGRDLASGTTSRDSLEKALRVLDRRLGAQRSVVYSVGQRSKILEAVASHGLPLEHFRPRFGTGASGRVAESGKPIVVPSLRFEPMALSDLSQPPDWMGNDWGLAALPIHGATGCSGVLAVYFRQETGQDLRGHLGFLSVVTSLMSQVVGVAQTEDAPGDSEPRNDTSSDVASGAFEYSNMIGASALMRQIYEEIGQVARTNATALIRGESGTGKELVAYAIHHNSVRARQPFVKVNCAALPETLFESELFGHERGAFTGAHARKRGRFELAQGGTLFLDEIGELSPATQAKLLRVLQSKEFERLGGTETLHADTRIIAATNRDLEDLASKGAFRQDLYYRLNVFAIHLPSLRDRRGDIPPLAEYFLAKYAAEHRRKISRISSGALDLLASHSWPGNVRELENVIERAVVMCEGFVIQEHHLPGTVRDTDGEQETKRLTLQEAVARLERTMLDQALRSAKGNCARAARSLGTTERIVRYKAGRYGIDLSRFRL
jgi:Nif-specific regulatory protein